MKIPFQIGAGRDGGAAVIPRHICFSAADGRFIVAELTRERMTIAPVCGLP